MTCIFCDEESPVTLPEYIQICNDCYIRLKDEIDLDNIKDYMKEEEEIKYGIHGR